ncbi:DoxX family membrane protein [Candidatus Uhrbacteria bacterium]|nr:DoxX family membrane protein [Candidatus Uhrbacteria bacterium]
MTFASRIVLRWSWALLFVWFGVQQLLHPAQWVAFLPVWIGYFPIPPEMLVQLNGWTEVCVAVLILVGCYTRFSAAFLALHLFGIAITAGGAIGVRDATLAMVGVSLALGEPDEWTLDAKLKDVKIVAPSANTDHSDIH